MTRARRVWIVDHDAPGHKAQAQGLADMLARQGWALERHMISGRMRMRGWLRRPLRPVFGWNASRLIWALARLGHDGVSPPDAPPDLIIGSGGRSAWLLRALGLRFGAPTVMVSPPTGAPDAWFTLTLAPGGVGSKPNTGLIVTRMTPQAANAAASARWRLGAPSNKPCWALLIGGRSRSHPFEAQDWRALAEGANALARKHNINWLVTTSRRTGAEAEAILAKTLDPGFIQELTLYGRNPDKVVAAYMGAASRVFVTRDSLTMMSEALASSKPVIALYPQGAALTPPGFFGAHCAWLAAQGWIGQTACADMAAGDPPAGRMPQEARAAMEAQIAQAIAQIVSPL